MKKLREKALQRVAKNLDKRIAALPPSQRAYVEKVIKQTKEEAKNDKDK